MHSNQFSQLSARLLASSNVSIFIFSFLKPSTFARTLGGVFPFLVKAKRNSTSLINPEQRILAVSMASASTSCFESGGMRPLMMVSRLVTFCSDSWTSMHNCPAGILIIEDAETRQIRCKPFCIDPKASVMWFSFISWNVSSSFLSSVSENLRTNAIKHWHCRTRVDWFTFLQF